MTDFVTINNRRIGSAFPVYIVAELSANHNKDFNQAVELIRVAKDCGADAIKLQTFTADTMTIPSSNSIFRIKGNTPWDGTSLYNLYNEASMPWEWQPKLKAIANSLGMDLFSSAFDISALCFLESMNVPVHKIASPEIVDIPLIERMARTGKPLIISTGMATLQEINEAVKSARRAGAMEIVLLKCNSSYPASVNDLNLCTILHLSKTFNVPVGFSDHTLGTIASVVAVSLGSCIIEKHLTLSRSIEGPDNTFSLEPHEFKTLVELIHQVELSLGHVHYGVTESESASKIFRRSLFVVKNIRAGETFTVDNIRSIRPAYGIPPKYLKDILGQKAEKNIKKGTPLKWDLIKEKRISNIN